MCVPSTSPGIKSGVNWMRLNWSRRIWPIGPDQGGLAQAGQAFEQDMSLAEDPNEDQAMQFLSAEQDPVELIQGLLDQVGTAGFSSSGVRMALESVMELLVAPCAVRVCHTGHPTPGRRPF
jgi:hypothetical protein